MKPIIIDSKLSAPQCGHMLSRNRLFELVGSSGKYRLKLICADAGYGKTILMGQLFSQGPRISVWYQLDKYDGDLRVFISHLVTGLKSHLPEFGEWVNERLSESRNNYANQGEILQAFVSELVDKTNEPVGIYLDDYHLVQGNDQINEATKFLVTHLHEGCSVTICTRERPEGLSLGKLKAQSELVEVSTADLRFSRTEARKLFKKGRLQLKDKEIIDLHEKTDGWAVGLALTSSVYADGAAPKTIGALLEKTNDIGDYLSEEVWASMDSEKKGLFMRASLVDTIDAEMLAGLSFTKKKATVYRILEDAVNRNMMIASLGEGRFRLHPLFRELLREKLRVELSAEEINELHLAYAQAFIEADRETEAIDHFIIAGKHKTAIESIIDHGDEVIDSGYVAKLEDWLNRISISKYDNGWMDYYNALIIRDQGEMVLAVKLGQAAYHHFSNLGNKAGMFRSSFMLSELFALLGDFDNCIDYARKAVDHSDKPEGEAEALNFIAIAMVWKGNYKEATNLLERASAIDNCSARIRLLNELVILNMTWIFGEFNELIHRIGYLSTDYDWKGMVYNNLRFKCNKATTMSLLGRYEEAVEAANTAASLAQQTGASYECWILRETLGHLDFCLGNTHDGMNAISDVERSLQDAGMTDASTSMHKGTCHRRTGDFKSALAVHSAYLEETKSFRQHYEYAICLSNIGADKQRIATDGGYAVELDIAESCARKYGYQYILTQVYFHRAWRAFQCQRRKATSEFISSSLQIAANNSHNHFLIQEGKISLELLAFALEQDIESQYLVKIFGMIGSDAVVHLRPLLQDVSPGVRVRAALALEAAGGLQVAPLIKKLLRDKDETVRDAAAEMLERLRITIKSEKQTLTPREGEVFQLLGRGMSNAEIGEQLFISEQTVKTHVTKIFRKLGLTRRSQAVIHLQQDGAPAVGSSNQ
ncbi:MAG: LuxR C-terminal-related transcriptional regulator [Thermoleophilia bacterium]